MTLQIPLETKSDKTESLRFSIDDLTYKSCNLVFDWEYASFALPIDFYTEAQMEKNISAVLAGPKPSNYNAAAAFSVQSGTKLEEGLDYIETAIARRNKPHYYDYLVKAKLLDLLGKKKEAEEILAKSTELAIASDNEFGQHLIDLYKIQRSK